MGKRLTFAPLRPINDVISNAKDYEIPDFGAIERVKNRIINNLLYYQTNYFLVVLFSCIIVA